MQKLGPPALATCAKSVQRRLLNALALISAVAWAPQALAQAINAPIVGEIQEINIDVTGNGITNHWSGGNIVVGGQIVTLPANLLIDLPANRVTLAELYSQAPAACQALGETGLAKGDKCNTTGMGGIATLHGNRTFAGNIIAGDAFIEKGVELVTGAVTYVNYADGYFRLNGDPTNAATTGVMVRLNDPDSRHTIQRGAGCAAGSTVNCSPDPRFTLDGDNYTNVFSTGYPLCIPSTVARPFPGLDAITGLAALPAGTAQAAADGTGDVLCPTTNRAGQTAADSRRFAPIQLGDNITAEGNFEVVTGADGVATRFLSTHSTAVGRAILTRNSPDQPDYVFLEEFEVDMAGFQNERLRTLMIGFATLAPTDVLISTIHYDPVNNAPHLLPMASVRGCDLAAGAGTCGAQGLVGAGNLIWKIRHDIDFLVGAKPRVNPCAHLQAEARFGSGFCPNGGALDGPAGVPEQFAIMSPIPHEVQAYTGHRLDFGGPDGVNLVTLDINGAVATNGQYLFPFGMGLGGISFPEMVEINLDALGTPLSFTGLPWTLDRRLSPAGCIDTSVPPDGIVDCEPSAQPLIPYPYEGTDPRTLAAVPQGAYADPNFTEQPLSRTANRIFSFVDANGRFQGNASVMDTALVDGAGYGYPPAIPAFSAIPVTPEVNLVCSSVPAGAQVAPVANADVASTSFNSPVTIAVLLNDFDANGDPLSVTSTTNGTGGTAAATSGVFVTYTPNAGFSGTDTFSYTISDARGGTATANVSVAVSSTVTVLSAGFDSITGTWSVSGTTTVPAAPIIIHVGNTVAGAVVGTAVMGTALVPPTTPWSFVGLGPAPGDLDPRMSIESTAGNLEAIFVTVR